MHECNEKSQISMFFSTFCDPCFSRKTDTFMVYLYQKINVWRKHYGSFFY